MRYSLKPKKYFRSTEVLPNGNKLVIKENKNNWSGYIQDTYYKLVSHVVGHSYQSVRDQLFPVFTVNHFPRYKPREGDSNDTKVIGWFLNQSILAGGFVPIQCDMHWNDLADKGYLQYHTGSRKGQPCYSLTRKARLELFLDLMMEK